jgi:hypothetical protein
MQGLTKNKNRINLNPMKKIILISLLCGVFSGCATTEDKNQTPTEFQKKHPVVTIETSGDLYYEENGSNVQMDLFGNCSPGQTIILIEVDKKKSPTQCKKGRYRYSLNLPQSFFGDSTKGRAPSSKYIMKQISAYHDGHENLSATSYILIDRSKKEVRSVINKQVKFEKIPTGDFEPVTQFNAFGGCAIGSLVQIEVTSPDRFGHQVSKFDEKKECQNTGGFYFLSQMHGYIKAGTQFKIHEDKAIVIDSKRSPASKDNVRFKNLLNWVLPIE